MPKAALNVSPASAGKAVMTPFSQRNAWVIAGPPLLAHEYPTARPLLLIATIELDASPGSTPRSVIAPFCQRNAWFSPAVVLDSPATWPPSLMANAWLVAPPSVPRSVITPFSQMKAWLAPPAVDELP